jgi:hypothetical protein
MLNADRVEVQNSCPHSEKKQDKNLFPPLAPYLGAR